MKTNQRIEQFGCICYGALLLLPLAGMFFGGGSLRPEELILNARRLGLLGNSLKLGIGVGLLTLAIGLFAAVWIRYGKLSDRIVRYYPALLLPIPYYIYALSWMVMLRSLAKLLPGLRRYMMQGYGACLFAEVLTWLPLAILLLLLAMESQSREQEEMAGIYVDPLKALFACVLPELRGAMAASFGVVFLLSVADFSVPSMFQYNTYALEIFSVYGRTGNALTACLMSWPLLLVTALPLWLFVREVRRGGFSAGTGRGGLILTKKERRLFAPAGILTVIQVAAPFLVFVFTGGNLSTILLSAKMIAGEVGNSVIVALIAGAVGVLCILAPARVLSRCEKMLPWMLSLLFIGFPGALSAMGLSALVNRTVFWRLATTSFLPALGCAIRYMPFALVILTFFFRRIDAGQKEAALLMAPSRREARKLLLRLAAPGLAAAYGLIFFFTMGEEGILLVLMAPGVETAAVKIYNYLHYGASEYVAGFCLTMMSATLLLEMLLVGVFHQRRRKEDAS